MKGLKEKLENIIISLMTSHDDTEDNDFCLCKNVEEYLCYIDSIRFIELITTVESEFDIEINNEDLVEENVKSFDKFMQLISKYVK
ncbi:MULTISPECIES: phosphopantetheine-binding protein [Peptoniphilaceae]|uniref:phosphopantetheine-binding protein n=1 Tax=Peptoniphilaceae TaxID=1570339 RepID=UPI000287A610|nr:MULTISPECIES: phosphopantetheine-binding protein [Peptoniphilaceae]